MTEQMPLFDSRLGALLREEGIRRADDHANPTWREIALLAVKTAAKSKGYLTTDDVWQRIRLTEYQTHEKRALGPVMRAAQKRGWIVPLDEWELSKRPECHRRPCRVWVSRLGL
jgi:hypothetical protein